MDSFTKDIIQLFLFTVLSGTIFGMILSRLYRREIILNFSFR